MAHFNLEDYETVEERLVKFWAKYEKGRVETHLIDKGEKAFIVIAHIYRDDSVESLPFASGMAEEIIGQGMVNKTSALENCETSAIGRALANGGFATTGKRASRTEMEKVARSKQVVEQPKPVKEKVVKSQEKTSENLAAVFVKVGLATTADELRELWYENEDHLDGTFDGQTLRAYIIQRKEEM